MKTKNILLEARKKKKAIGAFNVSSTEALQAVFEAAEEVGVPVVIQTSAGEAQHLTPELLSVMCTTLSKIHNVNYLLHLDRGNDLDLIKRCLKAGYTSISTEFATNNFNEIVTKTMQVRKLTRMHGALHEGALEIVPLRYYKDTFQRNLDETNPVLAQKFVERTGVDSLVVSIGNQSGKLKNNRKLDLTILKQLNECLPGTPFVLHGGSFLSDAIVRSCINNGVAKININTEIRMAFTNKLKGNIKQNGDEYAPYRLLKGVKETMKEIIKEKMILFNNL